MEIPASMAELLSFSTLALIFISLLSIALILRSFFQTSINGSTVPPSPSFPLPLIGHLHLLGLLPHRTFHRLSLRLGPLFRLRLGQLTCHVASSASTVKQILKPYESSSFSDRPVSTAILKLFYSGSDFTFSNGSYWLFIRKICMSQLLGGKTVDLQSGIRHDELHKLVRTIFEESKKEREVDMDGEFVRLANNIITRMTIGKRWAEGEEEAAEVKAVVAEVADLSSGFDLRDYIWVVGKLGFDLQGIDKRVETVRERFDRMMERVLRERKEMRRSRERDEKESKDILDMLLDIYEDEGAEMKLTMDNIKAFILDMFVAGTDTTSLTMEWTLSELINHPHILQKAAQEIDTIIGKDRLLNETDIPQLLYLQAIIKETLRLHPTGPLIARLCTQNCTVNNYLLPAGTTLFVNVWALGRDPECWENSSEFCPERFIGQEMDVRGQHYELLPFGTGRRICPGITLAMLVVQTAIGLMIQCFDWKMKDGGFADLAERVGITLSRVKPLVCVPITRPELLSLLRSEFNEN